MSMCIIKKAQTQVALQQRQPLKKDGASPLFSKSNCHVERTLMRNRTIYAIFSSVPM